MHPKEFPDGSEIDSVAEGPEAEDVLTMNVRPIHVDYTSNNVDYTSITMTIPAV